MRVTFNSNFIGQQADLTRLADQLAASQKQVSSGRRVSAASDDPAAAAAAIKERTAIASLDRYAETADDVSARLSLADTVLDGIIDQLTNAKTTILGARGSATTDVQRNAAVQQLKGIREALLSAFNTTFRGTSLFAGTAGRTAAYEPTPEGGVSEYKGKTTVASVDISQSEAIAIVWNADAIARGPNPGDADVFVELQRAIEAVENNDGAGMDTAMTAFGAAFERAVAAQTSIGTDMNAVETQQGRISELRRAAVARVGTLESANMAEAITRMTQADTAYRAALGAVGNTGRVSLLDYLR